MIEECLKGLSKELKEIELYRELCERVIILMRKNRIGKFTADTQEFLIKFMNTCYIHLGKELQSIKNPNKTIETPFKSKKEIIDIDWD